MIYSHRTALYLLILILFSSLVAGYVEPQEFEAESTTKGSWSLYLVDGNYYSNGHDLEMKEGDESGFIKIHSKLVFWNVGDRYPDENKKDKYGVAELKLTIFSEEWTKRVKCKTCKNDVLTVENKKFKPISKKFKLRFTGYGDGEFYYGDKKVGEIVQDGIDFYAKFNNWFLDEMLDGYIRTGNDIDDYYIHTRLLIPLPSRAFLVSCPVECNTDEHREPIRATFTAIQGEVEVIPCGADESDWSLARYDMIIESGECIRTGEDSKAIISFEDMSTLTIKEDTEVTFKYKYHKTLLQLISGAIWKNTKRMLEGGNELATVHMQDLVAGIKGTSFIARSEDDKEEVILFNGSVEVEDLRSGKKVLLKPGEKAVYKNKNMSVSKFNADDEIRKFNNTNSFPFSLVWVLLILVFVLVTYYYKKGAFLKKK